MDCLEYYLFVIYGWLKLLSRIVFRRILFGKFVKSIRIFYFNIKREDWNKSDKLTPKKVFFDTLKRYVIWLGVEIKEKKLNYGCCV
jgi:hypothetical protein